VKTLETYNESLSFDPLGKDILFLPNFYFMSFPPSSKMQSTAGLAAFALSVMLSAFIPALSVAPLANAQTCTPVSTANLLGHWKFDENTGTTTADSTGNGHTGTLQNGPVWSSGATMITPNPSALKFDGSNDQVTVTNSGDFNFGTGSFTVSLFAKTGSGNRGVLGNFSAAQRGWGLYLYSNNQANFFAYGTQGINDAAKPAAVLNNQWHHLAGVYSRSGASLTIRTYVDGALAGTQTATVGNITASSSLLFGRYLGQPYFAGSLDDIRVYGRSLTGGEVTSLSSGCNGSSSSSMSSTTSASSTSSTTSSSLSSSTSSVGTSSSTSSVCQPVTLGGLSAYWKFDETSGLTANDSTGFNNSGSLMNGASFTASGAPVNFANPRALSLDGVNDHVIVPNTTNLPSGNMPRTVSLWMRQDQIGNQATLLTLGNGNNANQKFIVQMGTSGGQTYLFSDGVNSSNNVTLTGSQIPSTNAWHHLAFVYAGTGAWQYYLDGTLRKTGTFPVALNTVTNDVEIGSRHDVVTGHFDGTLDDVRLYNRALTQSEVASFAAGCGNTNQTSSSSSTSSVSTSSVSTSSSGSSVSSSSSSVSSAGVPQCEGVNATIYVRNGKIVGGTASGATFNGTLNGTNGADVIVGTSGNDYIRGFQGNDRICGRDGNDYIRGDQGNDIIRGGQGNDYLYGDVGIDTLSGNAGNDYLFGGNGDDTLCGQTDADYLQGQNGNDGLDGGANSDFLYGGSGTNSCANGETVNGCTQTVNTIPACSNNNQ
jgi:Ca2+-binding RTX toxin-like protein